MRFKIWIFSILLCLFGCKNENRVEYSKLYLDTIKHSNESFSVFTMKDSVAHGIAWQVDKKDSLMPGTYSETFFLFDERVLDKVPIYSDDFIGYEVFYYVDTTEVIAGTWYYDAETHDPFKKNVHISMSMRQIPLIMVNHIKWLSLQF